jgi:uncharacterized protein YggE
MLAGRLRFQTSAASCLLALGILALATHAVPAVAEDKTMDRTITVSATGSATAVPDAARIQTGVVFEAATAREALSGNNAAMAKLIAGLKDNGIEAKDIQTSGFNLNPRYTNPRDGQPAVIDGYQASNQVEIHVRDLDKLGDVLDRIVTLGANQMNGIEFEVSAAETLRDAARKDAIANARRRAELYAAAAGAKVGRVVQISEGGGPEPRPYFKAGRVASAMEAVPVERGTQSLAANVTVTWELD